MKTYSIAEINDLDHGIPISRFEGRIKKVFDQKQGEGQYGTWYLQNLIVEDGQQEITVTWTGDDPFGPENEGQIYSFETGYDKKEKPVGIVRDIRTKNGKKYEGVKVDNRAKLKSSNGKQGAPSAFQQTKAAMQGDPLDYPNSPDRDEIAPQSPPHAQQGERRETGIPGFAKREYTHDSGPMSKDDYWRRKEDRDEERQRFIIRQHSQSMALEVLKLKVTLNELTVEDLTPAKLRTLADYFDNDVFLGTSK